MWGYVCFFCRQLYVAGIYLIGSGASIQSGNMHSFVDSACSFMGPKSIYPFAFRTHAHHLGMSWIKWWFQLLYYIYSLQRFIVWSCMQTWNDEGSQFVKMRTFIIMPISWVHDLTYCRAVKLISWQLLSDWLPRDFISKMSTYTCTTPNSQG